MTCPKCNRSMSDYHLLKRWECHYCDYVMHYHEKKNRKRPTKKAKDNYE